MTWDQQAERQMDAKLQEAERCGMWLVCRYQDIRFSPAELRKEQAGGRFKWGAKNWELFPPQDQVDSLTRKIKSLESERRAVLAKIEQETAR